MDQAIAESAVRPDREERSGLGRGRAGRRGLFAAWLPLAASVVAFAGLFAASVLGVGHLLDLPVPCGRGHGCVAVATHPSSRLFGVPIAFLGVAAYLAMIVLLGQVAASRRSRLALLAVAGLGTAGSVALLIYSQAVIRATCVWCLASGAAMTTLLVLAAALVWARGPLRPARPDVVFGLGLLTAAAVGVQAGQMRRAALTPPIPAERMAGVSAEELVDPAKSLGPADAPVTIVEFADLRCPACRAAHASLVNLQRADPGLVRLAFRHRPLAEIRGHESSGAAAALGEIAAEQGRFWPFVEAVYARRGTPDRAGYLQILSRLGMDPHVAEARIGDPRDAAVARVWRDVDLAERLGVDSTPTFLVLVAGRPPVSANLRTLPRVLNAIAASGEVTARLR